MSKYRVGEKSKNDNRVDSFIWHLGVCTSCFLIADSFAQSLQISEITINISLKIHIPTIAREAIPTISCVLLQSWVLGIMNFLFNWKISQIQYFWRLHISFNSEVMKIFWKKKVLVTVYIFTFRKKYRV